MLTKQGYDYIVIGAGSSGCVVANRLTEDPAATLLLLEAGGPDTKPEIHDCAAFSSLQKSEVDWQYLSETEPYLNGRQMPLPRGKVLGGTSSINAMGYTRGSRLDYDHWSYLGNPGWSYREVLPYFKKSENFGGGASDYHGVGGPLNVNYSPDPAPVSLAFLEAARQVGFDAPNWDYNGAEQVGGSSLTQLTITASGDRSSTAVAFLRSAQARPNLKITTDSYVTRILLEKGRATGVEYLCEGTLYQVRAEREVILSAGAFESPKLLMLSGIGPARQLKAQAIPVIIDLPGVGQNLQDHLFVAVGYSAKQSLPLTKRPPIEALLYAYSPKAHPPSMPGDIQIACTNQIITPDGTRISAFGLLAIMTRPQSRGQVSLQSADPIDRPLIQHNYLECEADLETLIAATRLARQIANAPGLASFKGTEFAPGETLQTDKELAEFIRNTARTIYHPTSTCKMGRDRLAVVDPELRVYGVTGLRVVDASVMPKVVNSPTNAACIMIGEKAADLIKVSASS